MSNRFSDKKRVNFALVRSLVLPILIFAAAGAFFVWGISSLTGRTERERLSSVENAITRAAVQAYAIEGQYPSGLSYLQKHYGLSIDTDKYIVEYRVFASNIMPSITVLPKDFSGDALAASDFEVFGGMEDEDMSWSGEDMP